MQVTTRQHAYVVAASDLRFLYVATGEVDGMGSLYKLDLVAQTSKKLVPDA